MAKKYIVNLTQEENSSLIALTSKGKTSSRIFKRANILLLANEGYPDQEIAEILRIGESTVHRTRQKFVEGGVEFALREEPRAGSKRKLDGKGEAFLVATACSNPPDGQQRWTMQLLANRLVEIEVVESISDETVRRCLKKTLEFSVLSRQCLDRRIPTIEMLQQQVEAWEINRNQQQATVNWRFNTNDARVKLSSLYPTPYLS